MAPQFLSEGTFARLHRLITLSLVHFPDSGQRRQARRAGGQEHLDGTYIGAPLALRADASRCPSPSRTRNARPKMDVPGGVLLAQARRSRAPLSRMLIPRTSPARLPARPDLSQGAAPEPAIALAQPSHSPQRCSYAEARSAAPCARDWPGRPASEAAPVQRPRAGAMASTSPMVWRCPDAACGG
jgi:hypothetical protein